MARRVTAAGGFYSFTSHAFGQSTGMGVALLIAACYTIFSAGVTGVTAYFANTTFNDWFGVDIPVWVWEFGTIGIMVALAFFHIELTAKILGVFLIIEVAALLVFSFATLFQPHDGLVLKRCCRGTSSTARQRLEGGVRRRHDRSRLLRSVLVMDRLRDGAELCRGVQDPKKIMGPATYISVIGLGVLYTFVTWMLVVAYGKAGIIPGINAQLERRRRLGLLSRDRPGNRHRHRERRRPHARVRAHDRDGLVRVSARVLQHGHALLLLDGPRGRPAQATRAHAPDASQPVYRIALVGVFCVLIVAGFLLHDSSTLGALLKLGTWIPMMGNIGILSVMALVSVAIIKYFATTAKDGQQIWHTVIAPIIATAAMILVTYLLIKYRTTLAGGVEPSFVKWMWIPPLAVFLIGIGLAQLYKTRDRARYDGIGRYLHEDVAP